MTVETVGRGGVDSAIVLRRGFGHLVGERVHVENRDGLGGNAVLEITATDGYGGLVSPSMEVSTLSVASGGSQYNVGDLVSLSGVATVVVETLETSVLTGTVVDSGGSGYRYATVYFDDTSGNHYTSIGTLSGGVLSSVPLPDSYSSITTRPVVYVNGSGCTGSATVTSNTVGALTVTTSGRNYVAPTVLWYTDIARTIPANVSSPKWTYTYNATRGITAITKVGDGYFDYVDTTVLYYTVVEEAGEGAVVTPHMGGEIATVSIVDRGEYTGVLPARVTARSITGTGEQAVFDVLYRVKALSIDNAGACYINPTLTFAGGVGDGAEIALGLSDGVVNGVTVNTAGSGYLPSRTRITPDNNGYGAILSPIYNATYGISDVEIESGGTGYTAGSFTIQGYSTTRTGTCTAASTTVYLNTVVNLVVGMQVTGSLLSSTREIAAIDTTLNTITLDASTGVSSGTTMLTFAPDPADIDYTVVDGVITSAQVRNPGAYYAESLTTIGITTSTGSGAVLTPEIFEGKLRNVVIANGGSAYDSADVATVTTTATSATGSLTTAGTGTVRRITVLNSGEGYRPGTPLVLTVSTPTSPTLANGGRQAVVRPSILDGEIDAVEVIDGGYGYVDGVATLSITGGGGSSFAATVHVNVVSKRVETIEVTNSGSGYSLGTRVELLGDGTGAAATAVLDTGVNALYIEDGGSGYVQPDCLIYDAANASAEYTLSAVNGVIRSATAVSIGSGYTTPVVTVYDNEGLARLSVNLNAGEVDTIDIVRNGFYTAVPDVSIIGDGTGATATAALDANGRLTTITVTASNADYTWAHAILISNTPTTDAVISGVQHRGISAITVDSGGINYENCNVAIIGDGFGCDASAIIEGVGNLESVSLDTAGSGYTAVPRITVVDDGAIGAISAVSVVEPGDGYATMPRCTVPINYARSLVAVDDVTGFAITDVITGADSLVEGVIVMIDTVRNLLVVDVYPDAVGFGEDVHWQASEVVENESAVTAIVQWATMVSNAAVAAIGTDIGAVRSVRVHEGGYGYDEVPYVQFPQVFITTDQGIGFRNAELVYVANYNYPLDDDDNPVYTQGPHGYVHSFDMSSNLLVLYRTNMHLLPFTISTEDYTPFVLESGDTLVNEANFLVDYATTLVGSVTGTEVRIRYYDRANGHAVRGGMWSDVNVFDTTAGMLSEYTRCLHNGERIQDFAYYIKSGLQLKDYERVLASLLHPAGYKQYGDVTIETFVELLFGIFESTGGVGSGGITGSVVLVLLAALANLALRDAQNETTLIFPTPYDLDEVVQIFYDEFTPPELDGINNDWLNKFSYYPVEGHVSNGDTYSSTPIDLWADFTFETLASTERWTDDRSWMRQMTHEAYITIETGD